MTVDQARHKQELLKMGCEINDMQAAWFEYIEDYYDDRYRPTVKLSVARILPKSTIALNALYQVIKINLSNQYRRAPDEKAIREALQEVRDGYPELSAPPQDVPLLEDLSYIPTQHAEDYLSHLVELMAAGDERWRQEDYHAVWLKARGVV